MKKLLPFNLAGFLVGLLFIVSNACSDKLEYSRISDYYDKYDGSMSYSYFKIKFKPTVTTSIENISSPVIHYGYNLTNNVIVKANIIESQIPEKDIKYIFNDTTLFRKLSPDTVYSGWIGFRGNYLTFPFADAYGFKLTNVWADSGGEKITSLPDWKAPLLKYAWACYLLPFTFFIAFASLFAIPKLKKSEIVIPFLLILSYFLPAAYVASMDYHELGFPYLTTILASILAGFYFIMLYKWATNKFDEI